MIKKAKPIRTNKLKTAGSYYRIPRTEPLTPRLGLKPNSRLTYPLADAIGFHRLSEYDFEGMWANGKEKE